MNKTELIRAFNGVDDEIIERCEKAATHKLIPLRRRLVMAIAAVLVVMVLMGAAAVVNYWDNVQAWVAYRWESLNGIKLSAEQADVVENLTQKVGVSQTANGVTISIDEAVVLEQEIKTILSITGLELPADAIFINNTEILINSQYAGGGTFGRGYEDSTIKIPVNISFDELNGAENIDVSITINNIENIYGDKIYAEGPWKFEFTLIATEFEKIQLPDTEIMAEYSVVAGTFEEMPQKFDESYTANGITVTAEGAKVSGARFKLLVRVDGVEIPEGDRYHIYGDNITLSVDPDQCADFRSAIQGFATKDGAFYMMIIGVPNGYKYDEPLNVTLNMSDFMKHELTGELLTDGEWSVTVALEKDTAKDTVPEERVMPITITNVELSAAGLSFEYEYEHGGYYTDKGLTDFIEPMTYDVYAVLEDGTEIKMDGGHGSGSMYGLDPVAHQSVYCAWPAPIDLDEVVEIHIGDTIIPVK
ncbi:MAG: DUF4179 domain-containing protein [Oscillospiraceae bacterium]|nr:DUF4179 domain-containing protein [Oscillospiraceae bacterium]